MYLSTFQFVFQKRRFRKLLGGLLILSLILTILLLPFELTAEHRIIQTPFDALWFSITTMTSVGYGDYVPVTVGGKVIGMGLQLVGSLIFGVIIALLTLSLNRVEDEFTWKRTRDRFDELEKKMERIEKNLSYIIKTSTEEESNSPQKKS